MKFTEVFLGETSNPETGELVTKVWCRTDTGRQLKVANDLEEIQALGSEAKVLSRLILVEGQYGPFARLSNVIRSKTSLFATSEADDVEEEEEEEIAEAAITAPAKALAKAPAKKAALKPRR